MSIRDDERAQTVQVGAILLLGTLVVAFSVYQVTSVPGQNGETEFTHNQQTQKQLQEVRNAILETAGTGQGRSATVALGTQYRDRIVAVNPAPPSGTLETVDLGNLTIANATAASGGGTAIESRDFWNGGEKEYASTALTYEPNYNEYREAPRTVYEHTVLANRFEEANGTDLLLSNQTFVDGRDITLVTLDGSLSATGSDAVPVDTRPISVSETVVPIESSGGPITLTLPTTLSESRWMDLLAGAEFASIERYDSAASSSEVTIRFEQGETYRLRMANIGVGSGAPATSAAYLTTAPGPTGPIAENDSRELRIEVRDRYNNPIGSETVNLTIVDSPDGSRPGTLAPDDEQPKSVTVTTDEQGHASVTYRAPPDVDADAGPVPVTIGANRTAVINVSEPLPANSSNTVRFDFDVTNTDGSKTANEIEWNRTALAARSGINCGPAGCTYDRSAGTIDASVFTSPATPNVAFDVRSADRTIATVSARADRTGPNGTAAGRIDVLGPGTVDLTVSSADSSDTLSLTTRNREPSASVELSPGTPRSGELVSFDAEASDLDGSNGSLEYEWDFGDGSRGFGPTPQHAYDEAGTYDVGLTVTDANGAETTVNRTITVSNRAPEAAIEYGPTTPLTGRTVSFDASDSVDPDRSDDALAYEWDLDSDGSFEAEGERATRQYADDGDREVTLRVTDEGGATVTTTATVSVRNREPIAEFGYGGDRTRGEPIGFDASGSSDRDGSIASYEWDFGDGPTATGVSPSHTYEEAGTYTVILEVTDDDNVTATKRESLTVDDRNPAATNQPPTAALDYTPSDPRTNDKIGFDASGSSDPNGDELTYQWELTRPNGRTNETTGERVTANPLPPGEYRMTLTVADGNATDTTSRTFTVTSGESSQGGGPPVTIDTLEPTRDTEDSMAG